MRTDSERGPAMEQDERAGRSSTSSEVVILDDRITAAANNVPNVANLNISKSSRVHIGPKFVSVTQNVNNTELVREMSLPMYLWNIVKNTTRAERISCAAALTALIVCTALIIYFTVIAKNSSVEVPDKAPHEWNITREMWLAQPYNYTYTTKKYEPLRLVVIQHSVSPECHTFVVCAAELRTLQSWYLKEYKYDLPYNFVIGNDGRVYEIRGWGIEGAHTYGYNRCSLGIGFIGDYRSELKVPTRVTEAQIIRTMMLLDEGVRRGYLHPHYAVVAAKDVQPTESPGSILHDELRKWKHYDHLHRFRNKTCDEIQAMPIIPVQDSN